MPHHLTIEERLSALETTIRERDEADKANRGERQEHLDTKLDNIETNINTRMDGLNDKLTKIFMEVFGNGHVEGSICWRLKEVEAWIKSYNGKNDKLWGLIRAVVTALLVVLAQKVIK